VAGTGARALDVPGRATKGWRILLYGTLGTNPDTAAAEADAGVRMAMLEVYWDRFEPRQNVVNQAYAAEVKAAQRAYREAGLSVTLGLDTMPLSVS